MTRPSWVPYPGGVCRVNGHVGRYLGNGMGAYLADAGSSTPPEKCAVRYYRATKPDRGDHRTHPSFLPTDEQLEAAARELGLRPSAKTGPVIASGEASQ
jgi:hypothetical protein